MDGRSDVQQLASLAGIYVTGSLNRARVCTCGSGIAGWGLHHDTCPVYRYYVEDPAQRDDILKELLEQHAPDAKLGQPRHQLSFQVVYWSTDVNQLSVMEKLLQQIEAGEHDRQTLGKLAELVISNADARLEIDSIDINFADDGE